MRLSFSLAFGLALLVPTQVSASSLYSYPTISAITAERDLPCYMHTAQNLTLNLSAFCPTSSIQSLGASRLRAIPTYSNSSDVPDGTYATVNGRIVDGSTNGPCDTPDQLDSRGNRCGGRAASERPGGR